MELGGRGHWNPRWKTFPKGQIDHVIPFSEGGLTVLENLRTLCIDCHKDRTRKWHKDRRLDKSQPELLPTPSARIGGAE